MPGPGEEIYALMGRMYPICRSITGQGVRETLSILRELIPLDVHEVPSGTRVFDWTVPLEWNITGAFIKDAGGKRVVDFTNSNLHVMSYSVPVKQRVVADELKKHVFTLPEHPDWIPYRTSYYAEDWAFCLSHRQLMALGDGPFDVEIDSTLRPGSLTYGECLLKGESTEEVLISTHICHPSLANDNLSGVATAVFLAKHIMAGKHRYSYRFLFIPGTIGAITWLALNLEAAKRIQHGLVLTGLGDPGKLTYKKSRREDTEIDQVAVHVLKTGTGAFDVRSFSPYGYDERQYCSPGLNLPVGRLSRTPYGEYAEYHTSADNMEFVQAEKLGQSFNALAQMLWILEHNRRYVNLLPFCEPQLGKRGIYGKQGVDRDAILWVLSMSDGGHSLLDIAEKAGTEFSSICRAAEELLGVGLIE
jgi:aminopeptidase-like protein